MNLMTFLVTAFGIVTGSVLIHTYLDGPGAIALQVAWIIACLVVEKKLLED
jgi:hypothetical protein